MWQRKNCGLTTPSHNFRLSPEVYIIVPKSTITTSPNDCSINERNPQLNSEKEDLKPAAFLPLMPFLHSFCVSGTPHFPIFILNLIIKPSISYKNLYVHGYIHSVFIHEYQRCHKPNPESLT